MSTTESSSNYKDLHLMSVSQLLSNINKEDQTVPLAIEKCIPAIEKVVEIIVQAFLQGGRLFYIGAGTSGRLGVVDASECPPTYGVPQDMVVGIIAGGDGAIRRAVEFAEDNETLAWEDLQKYHIHSKDVVIGIAASGRTPYVIGGVKKAKEMGIKTACVVCNLNSALAAAVDLPIEVVVGPEFVTGSTRMKAGTAQKLVLNMLTTASMIKIGRVVGNKMVDMQLSNLKLIDRGVKMVIDETGLPYTEAKSYLEKTGSVRNAIAAFKNQ
jgi:N-acetylmuramic acid 6-phosphate etherase